MTNTGTVFDSTKIANAVLATGLTINEVGFRVHMPFKTLQQIVDGDTTPIDVRVTTLERLATAIGLPLRSLFATPNPPPGPETFDASTAENHDQDATTVIAVLYDRGTNPTLNIDLAKGLGWTLQRLNTAYDEAEKRLAPAGLHLIRTHGEGSIAPTADHTDQRAAVEHARADNTGLSVDTYQAAYQVMTGADVLPGRMGYRRRLVIGRLANLGIVNGHNQSPTLTDATRQAFTP